ncbi:unnamed protein product [Amoebophrya sp. A120]|nr:unnamed protein product [Amoebophrya sp. A120]|eukprot:GSA120T00010882001.1
MIAPLKQAPVLWLFLLGAAASSSTQFAYASNSPQNGSKKGNPNHKVPTKALPSSPQAMYQLQRDLERSQKRFREVKQERDQFMQERDDLKAENEKMQTEREQILRDFEQVKMQLAESNQRHAGIAEEVQQLQHTLFLLEQRRAANITASQEQIVALKSQLVDSEIRFALISATMEQGAGVEMKSEHQGVLDAKNHDEDVDVQAANIAQALGNLQLRVGKSRVLQDELRGAESDCEEDKGRTLRLKLNMKSLPGQVPSPSTKNKSSLLTTSTLLRGMKKTDTSLNEDGDKSLLYPTDATAQFYNNDRLDSQPRTSLDSLARIHSAGSLDVDGGSSDVIVPNSHLVSRGGGDHTSVLRDFGFAPAPKTTTGLLGESPHAYASSIRGAFQHPSSSEDKTANTPSEQNKTAKVDSFRSTSSSATSFGGPFDEQSAEGRSDNTSNRQKLKVEELRDGAPALLGPRHLLQIENTLQEMHNEKSELKAKVERINSEEKVLEWLSKSEQRDELHHRSEAATADGDSPPPVPALAAAGSAYEVRPVFNLDGSGTSL